MLLPQTMQGSKQLPPQVFFALSADKIAAIQASLASDKADAAVLTLPESICWLLNMRGRDVPTTPFVLGFAVLPQTGLPTLYLDKA